jgi:hypothetical protein
LNLQGIEYIQKIENLNRLPLGRNHARPRCTVHAWPTLTTSAEPTCTARARPIACACRAGLGLRGPRRAAQRVSRRSGHAPGRASRCGRRRRHIVGGGANSGGRAPTTVRLPAGHGGGGDSAPDLLVDGEGEKTGSASVFF